ncbi:MAG: acyl carrier protein, partial [Okeania sp. SIO3B3]|nr:acyl carrier protein [Okeania sp. SIO3B3]
MVGVEWISAINRHYGLEIKATKLYDYPTLLELTNYLAEILSKQEKVAAVVTKTQPKIERLVPQPQLTTTTSPQVNTSEIKQVLKQKLADALYVDPSEIVEDQKFIDLGLDSIVGVEWISAINRHYGLEIKATKLYDYPTLLELTNYLAEIL